MPDRPNVLVITLHDLGDCLGCCGTPVKTPAIDSIAARGGAGAVCFVQAYRRDRTVRRRRPA